MIPVVGARDAVLTLLKVWESRENAGMELSEAVEFYWTFRNQEYTQESQAPCRKLDDLETACELANYTCVQSRPYYPEGLNCARLGMEFLLSIRISINFTGLFDPPSEDRTPVGPDHIQEAFRRLQRPPLKKTAMLGPGMRLQRGELRIF